MGDSWVASFHWDHEPGTARSAAVPAAAGPQRKRAWEFWSSTAVVSAAAGTAALRFMESPLSPSRMHRGHEPDIARATRNVAQHDRCKYDASDFGLLVGKIGSGQRHVYRLVSLCFPLERLVLLESWPGTTVWAPNIKHL